MVAQGNRKVAFLFPGQGSQRAGMAASLLEREPAARALFDRAGEALGMDVAEICTTGEEALLTRTDVAQPALLTTCLAWAEVLRERGIDPTMAAGHSLGEFSAWACAGALGLEETLRLVRRRGELMAEAGRRRPGGMLAVIGLPDEQVEMICGKAAAGGTVVAANYNSPGQVVVSGEEAALERVAEAAKQARARTIRLRVSGAFHSPLMEEAARSFSELVAGLTISRPRFAVVANATAAPVCEAEEVGRAMARQMTSPVLWAASVKRMAAEGMETFVEVGPGQVLTRLMSRISSGARALPVGSPEELDAAVEELDR